MYRTRLATKQETAQSLLPSSSVQQFQVSCLVKLLTANNVKQLSTSFFIEYIIIIIIINIIIIVIIITIIIVFEEAVNVLKIIKHVLILIYLPVISSSDLH